MCVENPGTKHKFGGLDLPKKTQDPEILKKGGALCRPPWLADEENFRFQIV